MNKTERTRNAFFNNQSDAALFAELAGRGWVINANKSNKCLPTPEPEPTPEAQPESPAPDDAS